MPITYDSLFITTKMFYNLQIKMLSNQLNVIYNNEHTKRQTLKNCSVFHLKTKSKWSSNK